MKAEFRREAHVQATLWFGIEICLANVQKVDLEGSPIASAFMSPLAEENPLCFQGWGRSIKGFVRARPHLLSNESALALGVNKILLV